MAGPSGQDLFLNLTGSGDTTLLAAPGAHLFIRVLHYNLTSDRPVTVLFKSGSETKTGTYGTFGSGGGIAPYSEEAAFDCNPNEALVGNLSVAANVIGNIRYTIKGGVTNQPGV